VKAFFSALTTLTVLPLPRRFHQCDEKNMAASVVYFPFVGLFVGVSLAGLAYFLKVILSPLVLAAVLLFVLVMFTGGLHLDGVADLADGLGAGGSPERMLAVMKESQVGAFGVIALVLVLLLKFSLFFEIIDKGRWLDFVLMALLSRWAMVLAAFLGKYPRVTGTGLVFIGQISSAQILMATGFTVLFSGLILGISGFGAMALAGLTTVSFVSYLTRRLGGITGDVLGTLNEKVEILVMLFLIVISPFGDEGLL